MSPLSARQYERGWLDLAWAVERAGYCSGCSTTTRRLVRHDPPEACPAVTIPLSPGPLPAAEIPLTIILDDGHTFAVC